MTASIRIKDLPDSERPRERLVEKGADALKNSELIAILLRTGLKGVSAIQVAEQLLQKFSTLDNLSRYEARYERSLDKSLRELERLRSVACKRMQNQSQSVGQASACSGLQPAPPHDIAGDVIL